MNIELNTPLRERVCNYQFEHIVPANVAQQLKANGSPPSAPRHAFEKKLVRKLGWSPSFAERAVAEYLKFVYLGVTGDSGVTPSRVVDQVWHEHLLFSKGYREFCAHVLQKDFDHHPELIRTEEQLDQFKTQYNDTVARYRLTFESEPPDDIWGVAKFPKTPLPPAQSQPPSPAKRTSHADISGIADGLMSTFDGGTSGSSCSSSGCSSSGCSGGCSS